MIQRLQQFVPDALPVVRKAGWALQTMPPRLLWGAVLHTLQTGRFGGGGSRMNGIKMGLGITPGEHIISANSALSRNIRHCFCLSCRGRLILQTDAQGAWFEHDLHALSAQQKAALQPLD